MKYRFFIYKDWTNHTFRTIGTLIVANQNNGSIFTYGGTIYSGYKNLTDYSISGCLIAKNVIKEISYKEAIKRIDPECHKIFQENSGVLIVEEKPIFHKDKIKLFMFLKDSKAFNEDSALHLLDISKDLCSIIMNLDDKSNWLKRYDNKVFIDKNFDINNIKEETNDCESDLINLELFTKV